MLSRDLARGPSVGQRRADAVQTFLARGFSKVLASKFPVPNAWFCGTQIRFQIREDAGRGAGARGCWPVADPILSPWPQLVDCVTG